jgi:hypothetical protein
MSSHSGIKLTLRKKIISYIQLVSFKRHIECYCPRSTSTGAVTGSSSKTVSKSIIDLTLRASADGKPSYSLCHFTLACHLAQSHPTQLQKLQVRNFHFTSDITGLSIL